MDIENDSRKTELLEARYHKGRIMAMYLKQLENYLIENRHSIDAHVALSHARNHFYEAFMWLTRAIMNTDKEKM